MHKKITQNSVLGLVTLPNFQALRDHEVKSNLAIEHILGGTKEGKAEKKKKDSQKPFETQNADSNRELIPTARQFKGKQRGRNIAPKFEEFDGSERSVSNVDFEEADIKKFQKTPSGKNKDKKLGQKIASVLKDKVQLEMEIHDAKEEKKENEVKKDRYTLFDADSV